MSSDTPPVESVQDIQVRLKPVFGVEPKYYLAGIYLLIILVVLTGLLVWPGLSNPGTRVTVTSTPAGAAVFYGGKHYGTTPVTVFLPEGKGVLQVSKPGFLPSTRDFVSGNNLVFSLFFPRVDAVSAELKPVSEESVALRYTAEIGRWALAIPFSSTYRFPPLYTDFAADAKAAGWDDAKIKAFLLGLRSSVADPQMYLDYGRALGLWGIDALPPEGLETQFNLWSKLVGSSDRLALWLLANQTKLLRDREATASDMSDWFKAKLNGFQTTLKAAATPTFGSAPGSLRSSWGTFRGVGSATYLWAATSSAFSLPTEPPFQLSVPVTTQAFWIAETEVTQGQYAAFIAALPQWAPANRDALVVAGKVDAEYLKDWADGKPASPSAPVASVSWYAAKAFVAWLNTSGQVPGGKRAVLPDDFQWEAAARSGAGNAMVNQGVWEWTASAYLPGDSLVWDGAAPAAPEAYARSLKGGIQVGKNNIQAGDRAGWPAAGTMPTLGFRVALVGAP